MHELSEDYEKMYENAVDKLATYIVANSIQSLVIGVSGGIDSALVAALAHEAIRVSDTGIPLIGRSITIESNKQDEIARAKLVGERFCDDFKELDLTDTYLQFRDGLETLSNMEVNYTEAQIACGNIKARIRMIQLYHLAGVNKGMVLSAGHNHCTNTL